MIGCFPVESFDHGEKSSNDLIYESATKTNSNHTGHVLPKWDIAFPSCQPYINEPLSPLVPEYRHPWAELWYQMEKNKQTKGVFKYKA